MKDHLPRLYFHPTADMRKAINRNAKQDEGLSLVLMQIDKEKRIALDLLSRKQDAFKKQMLKRRETLANNSRVQLFEQGNVAIRDRPRPQEMEQVNRVRRTLSCEETGRLSVVHKPTVICKRHSLSASEGDVTSLRRTENTSIRRKNVGPREENCINKDTLTQNHATNYAIRRHSAVTFPDGSNGNNNVRLLPRRRLTIHSFARPGTEHEMETLTIL